MCKSHHVTTDKGVDGRTHHNPDDFASPIVKVAFVEKLLAPRLLAYEPERMFSIKVTKAPEKFPFRSRIGDMWTVLYFQPNPEGKTTLRIVGMGFGKDEESQKMKAFFEQGNAYTLAQLQKRFQ